jgi:hypothetical protein
LSFSAMTFLAVEAPVTFTGDMSDSMTKG